MKILLIFISIGLLVSTSCKKYEEGPFLSLKSKKERLSNTWQIENANENGVDLSSNFEGWKITITPEGYFFYFTNGVNASKLTLSGQWTLSSNNEVFSITYFNYDGVEVTEDYQIVRLKENNLWLRNLQTKLEIRLIPT